MSLLKEYPFAQKTVLLFSICFTTWVSVLITTSLGYLNIPAGVAILSFMSYICFTPMHEAGHGNIAGRFKKYRSIESFIGFACALTLFVPYPVFKILHLRHHSFTNDPKKDPDYWVATTNPFLLIFKLFTIKLSYYYHALFKPTDVIKKKNISIPLTIGFYILLIYIFSYFGPWKVFLLLWLSSAVLALAFLAFVFDWLPHTPHKKVGRYVDTSIFDINILTPILLYQNYHMIHHLYPRIPFYNYRRAYLELEDDIRRNNGKVIKLKR